MCWLRIKFLVQASKSARARPTLFPLTTAWGSNKVHSNRNETKAIGSKEESSALVARHFRPIFQGLRLAFEAQEGTNEVAHCPRSDQILGLNEPISRRDFLDGMLMTSRPWRLAPLVHLVSRRNRPGANPGAPVAGWSGYSGEGDYKGSAGNTEAVLQNAHGVRDGKFDKNPSDLPETSEVYDCVVVGGGHAGLSAGMFFNKQADAKRTCLILDNAHIFGGVAKRNEFVVDGHTLVCPAGFRPLSAAVSRQHPQNHLRHDGAGLGCVQVLSKMARAVARN